MTTPGYVAWERASPSKERLRIKTRTPISEEARHMSMLPMVGARKTGSVKKSKRE